MNMKNKHLNKLLFSKRGIRLIWSIFTLVTMIFIGEILLVDPFVKLLSKIGLSEVTGAISQNWSDALGDSIKRLLRSGIVIVSTLLVVKYLLIESPSFIGIDFKKKRYKELVLGIGLGFLVQIVSITLMISMGWFEFKGFSWDCHSVSFIAPAMLFIIVYCIETGVIEEVIFRGFLLNIFENRYSTNTGVVVSSVIFGLVHFSGFEGEFAWWMSIISSLAAGFLFAQAFLLFRSLWLPFGFHAGWHLAMRTLGSVGLSSDEAVFMITEVDGPSMLISTKAGGAGLFELVGAIVTSLIMFFISKNLRKNKQISEKKFQQK
jgi:membrane protease YdiL (CAAX protease family)